MIRNLRQQQAVSIYATILLLCRIPPTEIATHVLLFAQRHKNLSKRELNEALRRILQTEAIQNINLVKGMRK